MSIRRAASESGLERLIPPPVTLTVEYEGLDDFVIDCAEHVSSGGMFLGTEQELEVGAPVRLVFGFPGLRRPVACSGVVRYRRSAGYDERGLGIELADLDREQLGHIVSRVRARDPEVVARVLRVLVVEDNPYVAQLIRAGLEGSGRRAFANPPVFQFSMAQNGREALDALYNERFDALIIDIYLPILDGVNVIARVRDDARFRDLPIIAVSAGGKGARDDALGAGADRFLHKPMRLRHVLDAMRELVQLDG